MHWSLEAGPVHRMRAQQEVVQQACSPVPFCPGAYPRTGRTGWSGRFSSGPLGEVSITSLLGAMFNAGRSSTQVTGYPTYQELTYANGVCLPNLTCLGILPALQSASLISAR